MWTPADNWEEGGRNEEQNLATNGVSFFRRKDESWKIDCYEEWEVGLWNGNPALMGNFGRKKKFKPLIQKHAKLKEEFWLVFYLYFLCGRDYLLIGSSMNDPNRETKKTKSLFVVYLFLYLFRLLVKIEWEGDCFSEL